MFDLSKPVARLESVFPEVKFLSYGGAVPVQAFGHLGSKFFYFRFRHGEASLTVGSERHGDFVKNGVTFFYEPDQYTVGEGVLDEEEFYHVLLSLFKTSLKYFLSPVEGDV
jgi:hypothetical protein